MVPPAKSVMIGAVANCIAMANFSVNSAIPSEGSMRTSWPRLRNSYYANLALRSIPAKTTAGQQPCAAAPEPL